jgi:hypothetical protein
MHEYKIAYFIYIAFKFTVNGSIRVFCTLNDFCIKCNSDAYTFQWIAKFVPANQYSFSSIN